MLHKTCGTEHSPATSCPSQTNLVQQIAENAMKEAMERLHDVTLELEYMRAAGYSTSGHDHVLDLTATLIEYAAEVQVLEVEAARANGVTWAAIGEPLGMTAQGAQQKFRRRVA